MVTSYARVLGPVRVQRSTRCKFSREPKKSVLGLKFVTSITSVLPSQWPRESPYHWRMLAGKCGLPFMTMLRLPAFPLTDVVEHRDAAGSLHDAAEAAAERGAEFGQPMRQAAVGQRAVLRTVVAIDAPEVTGVVARRRLRAPRRGHRIVSPAPTLHGFGLARFGRLQQGETKCPIGSGRLLSCGSQGRNPAIGRIGDPRRARAGALRGQEDRQVVGARKVAVGRPPAEQRRSRFVQFFPLRRGEEFLVRVPGRTL